MQHVPSRSRLLVAALGVALLGAALTGCGNKAAPAAVATSAPIPVQLGTAQTGPVRSVLTYSGAIQSSQQVNLTPRTSGPIAGVLVDVGSAVHTGDRLAYIDPGTLPSQVAQAQASVDAAQAKLNSMLAGSKTVDIAAAQSAYDAAQARLDQLQHPLLTDVTAVQAAVATAQTAVDNAGAGVTNAKATLIGQVYIACYSWGGFGIPCNNLVLPLPSDVTDNMASSLTTGVGQIGATPGALTVAVLQANAAYVTALNNQVAAQQALATTQAKRDSLLNPSASDIAAARSAVDQARSALSARQQPYTDSDLQGARAAVAQATAALGTAQTLLDQTNVIAPFDGVIAQKLLDVGSSASSATPIFVLSANAVEVHLTIEEARIALVRPGLSADLTVAAYPGKTFTAKVASIAPNGDARAHTFDVKVFVQDPQSQLRAGMFAQVSMVTAEKASALLVPSNAVLQQPNGSVVVTVADGKASFRPVQTGVSDQTNTEIVTGLKAGDQVVVVGQNGVRDGQAVTVSQAPAATSTAVPPVATPTPAKP